MHLNIGKALSEGAWDRMDAENIAKEDWVDDMARFSTDAGVNAWATKVKCALQKQSEVAVMRAGWQLLFAHIDSDGGGTLDCAEFTQALRAKSITTEQCSDSDIANIFTAVDSSGDGHIDANEFTSWMIELRIKRERCRRQRKKLETHFRHLVEMVERFHEASLSVITRLGWAQLFASFDADGSGSLDEEELLAALQKHGIVGSELEVGDRELREVFKLMDEDNSGKIGSTEFVNALQSKDTETCPMNFEAFQSSMFELVDYWAFGPTEAHYVEILKALFHAICCPVDIWRDEADVPEGSARHPRESWGISQIGWDSSMRFQDGSIKYKLLQPHQVRSIVVDGCIDLSHAERDEKRTDSRREMWRSKRETAYIRAGLLSSRQTKEAATAESATAESATAESATAESAAARSATAQAATAQAATAIFATYKAARPVQMRPFSQISPEKTDRADVIWTHGRLNRGGSTWASKPGKIDPGRPVTGSGTRCEKPAQRFGLPHFSQQWPNTTTPTGSPRLGGSGSPVFTVVRSPGRNRPRQSPTPSIYPRATASPVRLSGFESRSPSISLRTPHSPLGQQKDCYTKPNVDQEIYDRTTPRVRMRQTFLGYAVESAPASRVLCRFELPAVGVRAGSIAGARRDNRVEAVVMSGESPRRAVLGLAAVTDTSTASDRAATPRKHLGSDGNARTCDFPGPEMESAPVEPLVYYRCGHNEFVPRSANSQC